MKRLYKYMSAFVFTGLLAMVLTGNVYAQHRSGGGGHGGGGFHGAVRGGGGGFRGGAGGYHGAVGARGYARGAVGVRSGAVGVRGGVGSRGYARGAVGVRGGAVAVRGGFGGRGYYGRGGYYGRNYFGYGYGGRFRFGIGWGYPHFGLYFGFLPYGYYPFYWNSYPYYYYGGVFYRPYNGGYEVAAPPMGASVPNLPSNAQSIVIDGVQYYEADGVYYQPDVDQNGKTIYVVVGKDGVLNTGNGDAGSNQPANDSDDPTVYQSPANSTAQAQPQPQNAPQAQDAPVTLKVGDVVDKLPDDCRKVTLNNKKYYVSPDNVFFEEYKDDTGKGYRVASVPPSGAGQGQ